MTSDATDPTDACPALNSPAPGIGDIVIIHRRQAGIDDHGFCIVSWIFTNLTRSVLKSDQKM